MKVLFSWSIMCSLNFECICVVHMNHDLGRGKFLLPKMIPVVIFYIFSWIPILQITCKYLTPVIETKTNYLNMIAYKSSVFS